MSDAYDAYVVEVKQRLGGLTLQQYVEAHPGEHLWATYGKRESCAFCGVVRRCDGENNPCRGIVRIGLR